MTKQIKTAEPNVKLIELKTGGTLGLLHRKAAVDTYLMTLSSYEQKQMYTIMFGEAPMVDLDGPDDGVKLAKYLSGRQTKRLGLALEHPTDDVPEMKQRKAWFKNDAGVHLDYVDE